MFIIYSFIKSNNFKYFITQIQFILYWAISTASSSLFIGFSMSALLSIFSFILLAFFCCTILFSFLLLLCTSIWKDASVWVQSSSCIFYNHSEWNRSFCTPRILKDFKWSTIKQISITIIMWYQQRSNFYLSEFFAACSFDISVCYSMQEPFLVVLV